MIEDLAQLADPSALPGLAYGLVAAAIASGAIVGLVAGWIVTAVKAA